MLGGPVEETFAFFPLLVLRRCHTLRRGTIGPASELLAVFPDLGKFVEALRQVSVDGTPLEDPVLAASSSDHSKFLAEIECIAYLADNDRANPAADEVFGQRVLFTTHTENGRKLLGIDRHALMSIEGLVSVRLRNFPVDYTQYDLEKISDFESDLEAILSDGFYSALAKCVDDVQDKDARRERNRIMIAIMLHNQASLEIGRYQPFSQIDTVLMAAALEALLNLPAESLRSSFRHALTTLLGDSSRIFNRWCAEFYEYRSELMHGAEVWGREERTFGPSGTNGPHHSFIARQVFLECLKTKLFLMGLYPEYTRAPFEFDKIIAR